jgi:hypothetical protein
MSGSPTVVLEHGAFADASSWNGVILEAVATVGAASEQLLGSASEQ